jgi:gamma-glutamyltranspeptidase/glutathione hydrolase
MKRQIASFACAVSLVWLAFLVTTPIATGQAAAEYRTRAGDAKPWPKDAVRGAKAMVATDEELGSKAGVGILKRGGNAVDAAVAVAFALAVVEPSAGNIGGGGFMLVRQASGRTTFLDYREVAPGGATRNMYITPDGKLDEDASVIGYKSMAVPGTVAGLELAEKTYGTMKLAEVMEPAIRLAENGFAVSDKLARQLQAEKAGL